MSSTPWATANSLPELARHLPPTAHFLQQPLAKMAFQLAIPQDAKLSILNANYEPGLSVGEFLVAKELHRKVEVTIPYGQLLSAFKRWIGVQHASQAPTEDAKETLRAALAATGLPDAVQLRPGDLLPGETLQSFDQLLSLNRFPYRGDWLKRLTPVLHGLAKHLDAARAEERARSTLPTEAELSGDAPLLALRRAAVALRRPLLDRWPRGVLPVDVRLTTKDDGVVFFVSAGAFSRPETVSLGPLTEWLRRPCLDCTCRFDPCLHRAAALDALINETSRPNGGPARLLAAELQPRWERALDEFLAHEAARTGEAQPPGVLAFEFTGENFIPRVHAVGKRGLSKTGKALRDWSHPGARLSGQDKRIAEAMRDAKDRYGSTDRERYGDALLLLDGHPNVFDPKTGERLDVRTEDARIAFEPQEDGALRTRFFVGDSELMRDAPAGGFPTSSGAVVPSRRGSTVALVRVSRSFLALSQALHRHGPVLPREALPKLAGILPGLESAATLELPEELKGEERPPESRPVVRVEPAARGVVLAIRVEPLKAGPLFVPGTGAPLSAAFDGTRRTFARRDFDREVHEASALAGELGLDPAAADDPSTWLLEPGDHHVETLRRLSVLAQRGLTVEWKVTKPTFTSEARIDRLSLSIAKRRDWFGLDGAVEVDDRRVALAELLEAARARRRWVRLGDDAYAQLSEHLVQRLAPLAHLSEDGETPTLTLGTVPLVDALAAEVQALDAIDGWKKLTERLAHAKETNFPVPKALKADLRDYQVEGFRWLSRLAEWGAGAVLADDMGLGKTLQALAVLVGRASQGPALVVAPASVLHTWRTEAARFAPGLALSLFHEGDRSLDGLGKKDVVVASWSLFQREAERFAATRFATVVLDEAHAIKNASTQRAKAAHRLQADFIVALSGTPVENHVGELWSLFRAVMPSLLGSEESFRRRFGSGSREALQALSALVQPFILRRTKGQVAKELPPRTELDLVVPLTSEERALYDDVRLSAVKGLGEVIGESQRFEVLAALTRLRLTACHPRLVDQGWAGPASKLARLLELLKDLSASGHRVLVFSQFTSHLALVSEALRQAGLVFSYLDGQVPIAERQRRVETFQAGKGGDVFLISLKAGGTGLTLTAADYVIHLDPWWNPAVEDQASDRAHRIGQDKPVTVYRLIAEGTIEQQILSLHKDKRELVDALLAGTDTAGKLGARQLADLIRGGGSER